jgi:hypothetical protein
MRFAGVILAGLVPFSAHAGAIERACNASDRNAASRELCSCIQEAADATLNNSEQRRAAKFFSDPDKAQETRQSDSSGDESFWQRYKSFGQMAEAWCAPAEQTG